MWREGAEEGRQYQLRLLKLAQVQRGERGEGRGERGEGERGEGRGERGEFGVAGLNIQQEQARAFHL